MVPSLGILAEISRRMLGALALIAASLCRSRAMVRSASPHAVTRFRIREFAAVPELRR
jgi:hypothetical protein